MDKLTTFLKRWRLFYLSKAFNSWKEFTWNSKLEKQTAHTKETTKNEEILDQEELKQTQKMDDNLSDERMSDLEQETTVEAEESKPKASPLSMRRKAKVQNCIYFSVSIHGFNTNWKQFVCTSKQWLHHY